MDPEIRQLIERGRDSFERRDYVAALADFREVLRSHPNFADIHHLTALCLSFLGQPEAALDEFDRALELNEQYVEAHLNRAITLNELGRYEEAQESFERAGMYEADPFGRFPAGVAGRLANAHAGLGDLYLEAYALAEAAEEYRRALELRPRFLDIRNKLAQTLLQLGELEAAEAELTTVLEGNGRFLAARLNLGLVYYRRGEREHAAREWEHCREQSPSNPQVRAYLALLGGEVTPAEPGRDAG
ncbi:MAG: tetratricopeptide repeat protein [Gemmatimonadetes bacterium]|nr:tetratricopeptide repeat protein [Gemmatimonadota bacterium]